MRLQRVGVGAIVFLVLVCLAGIVLVYQVLKPEGNLSDANVTFIITRANGDQERIKTGDTLSLTPEETILIEVDVTLASELFPHLLYFQYFASRGITPPACTGPRASYVAPKGSGPDAITVSITDQETNEQIIRSINVMVR